jgi:hypothetical protein
MIEMVSERYSTVRLFSAMVGDVESLTDILYNQAQVRILRILLNMLSDTVHILELTGAFAPEKSEQLLDQRSSGS